MAATPEEVAIAQWMFQQYQLNHRLLQAAARDIRQKFGEQHVYRNKHRNWAINKPILDEFRKLTPDDTVWSRSSQAWRQRRPTDPPGKRMVR